MYAVTALVFFAFQALAEDNPPHYTGSSYRPVAYHLGEASPATPTGFEKYVPSSAITLDASSPVLSLDYGAEVAGFPYFSLESLSGSEAQIEVKYSEPYDGLGMLYSDGPFLFVVGLMNSFRVETFNVTDRERTESFFIQGGQRWQAIKLLTNSSVTITDVGFRPSVDIKPANNLPGAFSASDESLSPVWDLGARAVQAACVETNSQPSTWEITPEGALIRGQYPGTSAKGLAYGNYTMSFSTKIVSGGTGWRVAASANSGYGAYFLLTTSGPHFVNANSSVVPPNSLTAGYGFSIIDQAVLPSAPPQHFKIPFIIEEDTWYRISTSISAVSYNISINGTQVASIAISSISDYILTSWGNPRATDGTWGFAPFQDQSAYFTDVEVIASDGKTLLYSDSLTDPAVLPEYRVAANRYKVCLDGAKRDRLIWIGDFAHTARELAASSGRYDFVQSMIDFTFDWQLTSGPGAGLVPIEESMGDGFQFRADYYPKQYLENDYYIFFLLTVGDYWGLTEDVGLMRQHWNGSKRLVDTLIDRFLDPNSELLADPNGAGPNGVLWFTAQGGQNATAPTALFVIALQGLVPIAHALKDTITADYYTALARNISTSINDKLWSDSIGSYTFSLTDQTDHSILSAAFPIRAGIANTTQATRSIQSLSDLFLDIGYKDSTLIPSTPTTQLSPNVQGFLLESLFLAHTELQVPASVVAPVIKNMLGTYWPHMVTQPEYATGAAWEYVYANGEPGIGIFTSLCHPWGGAPTYILSNYVLGVRRELVKTGGSQFEWVVDPVWDVVRALGLKHAEGRMPLPQGGVIAVTWSLGGGKERCDVSVHGARDVHVNAKGNCRVHYGGWFHQ